jgi:hypothetical protein
MKDFKAGGIVIGRKRMCPGQFNHLMHFSETADFYLLTPDQLVHTDINISSHRGFSLFCMHHGAVDDGSEDVGEPEGPSLTGSYELCNAIATCNNRQLDARQGGNMATWENASS